MTDFQGGESKSDFTIRWGETQVKLSPAAVAQVTDAAEHPGGTRVADIATLITNDTTGEFNYVAYYDREGNRISLLRQGELARDLSYKLLRNTNVPGGEVVSAWLGDDQRDDPTEGEPLIYGTILLSNDAGYDHSVEEFAATAEECLSYHDELVSLIIARSLDPMAPLGRREEPSTDRLADASRSAVGH